MNKNTTSEEVRFIPFFVIILKIAVAAKIGGSNISKSMIRICFLGTVAMGMM